MTVQNLGLATLLSGLALTACGSEPTVQEKLEAERQQIIADGMRNAMAEYERSETLYNRPLSSDPPAGLAACKASIGELMSQSPSIISGKRLEPGKYQVTYVRPSDAERWTFRCRATVKELQWSGVENGQQRPWMGGENIRYKVDGGRLILTLQDLNGTDYNAVFTYPKLDKLR